MLLLSISFCIFITLKFLELIKHIVAMANSLSGVNYSIKLPNYSDFSQIDLSSKDKQKKLFFITLFLGT